MNFDHLINTIEIRARFEMAEIAMSRAGLLSCQGHAAALDKAGGDHYTSVGDSYLQGWSDSGEDKNEIPAMFKGVPDLEESWHRGWLDGELSIAMAHCSDCQDDNVSICPSQG